MTVSLLVLLFATVCLQVGSAIVYKVTTIQQSPFTKITTNYDDGKKTYEGFLVDILDELRTEIGVNFTISPVPDGLYGSLNSNGTWNGMIGQLVRREADIAVAPLVVTAMRLTAVDFSYPFMMTGPQILMKIPRNMDGVFPGMLLLLNPFSTEVWIILVIAYVAASVSVYVISRWSPFEWRQTESEDSGKETFSFSKSWLYTASTLLWQGYGAPPKSFSGRMLSVFWWSFAFLLLASYIASLTGRFILNRPTFERGRINTFQELADSAITYGTIQGGSTESMFKNSRDPLKMQMWAKMRRLGQVESFDEGVDRVSREGYAFITDQASSAAAARCDMYVARERLTNRGFAFACRKNLDILPKLNQALLKMQENERLEILENAWLSPCEEPKPRGLRSLKADVYLKDMAFPFILLAFGIVASLLVCVVEICLGKKGIFVPSSSSQNTDGKRSPGADNEA